MPWAACLPMMGATRSDRLREGDAQRGDALLDDARLVGFCQVRQGDERSRQEAQAEVVVAQ